MKLAGRSFKRMLNIDEFEENSKYHTLLPLPIEHTIFFQNTDTSTSEINFFHEENFTQVAKMKTVACMECQTHVKLRTLEIVQKWMMILPPMKTFLSKVLIFKQLWFDRGVIHKCIKFDV